MVEEKKLVLPFDKVKPEDVFFGMSLGEGKLIKMFQY
jgi:hypothetical protein